MLNKEVIDDLIWLWSLFDIRLLTFIAACFTIYLGYQKVDKKVSVSYSLTTDLLYGTHISNIILANKRDNVITISSVLLKIGEEGRVILFETENPLIVKAYETTMIEIPKYSYLTNGSANVTFDFNKKLNFSILTAYGKVIDCVEGNHILTDEAHKTISKHTFKLNNLTLTKKMNFVLFYIKDKKEKVCVIDHHFFINMENPFHFNKLSKEDCEKENFAKILKRYGYHELFDNYMLFKVDSNLDTKLILHKYESVNEVI